MSIQNSVHAATGTDSVSHDEYLRAHYERLGDQSNDFRNKNLVELLCSMTNGPDVLDIGCGTGRLLNELHKKGYQRLVGVEPSQGLIDLAKQLRPHLDIVAGTSSVITKIEGQFDTVTIIDVLEHIEDDERQLRMIFDRVKPGGKLVVLVPAHPILFSVRDEMQGHFRRYSRRELVDKLKRNGFHVHDARAWNAIGWLPSFIYGRLLRQTGGDSLRSAGPKNAVSRFGLRVLDAWYNRIENRFSFGFGLSLICQATRPVGDSK